MASSNRETAAWRPVRATTRITDGIPKIPGGMHVGGIRSDTSRKNAKLFHALMEKGLGKQVSSETNGTGEHLKEAT